MSDYQKNACAGGSPSATGKLADNGLLDIKGLIGPGNPLPLSRSTIYALMAAGKFPRPQRISSRRVAWRVEDIRKFLAELGEA